MSDIYAKLERADAVLHSRHFVYDNGEHGPAYINTDSLFKDVTLVRQLGIELVTPFAAEGIEVVAGPAVAGIALVYAVAFALQQAGQPVSTIWADKTGNDSFAFTRAGFAACLRGRRTLVVASLSTTGGSVDKVCQAAQAHGAEIIGASVIVNRGAVIAKELGVPRLIALAGVRFNTVHPGVCRLCQAGVPIVVDIGRGAEFAAANPDYPGGYYKLNA